MSKDLTFIKIYIYVYLFLMLYKPTLLPISMNYFITIWAFLGILINGINKKIRFKLNYFKDNNPFRTISITILLIVIYLIIVISFTSKDYSLVKLYVIYFAYLIQAYYAIILFKKYSKDSKESEKYLINICIIQAIFCCIMIIFPNIRQTIINYLASNSNNSKILFNAYSVRIYGIAGEYLYTIGLIHGVMTTYLINGALKNRKTKNIIIAIFILIPAILNARIGVVCCLTSCLFILIINFLKGNFIKKINIIKLILIVVIMIFIAKILCEKYLTTTYVWINDGIEAIIDLIMGNENKYYGKLTSDFLVWPQKWQFIFGKGVIPGGINYFKLYGYVSDIGYVIDVHIGGIILSILMYTAWIKVLFDNWKIKAYEEKAFSLSMILFIALANYKGRIVGAPEILILIILLMCKDRIIYKNKK